MFYLIGIIVTFFLAAVLASKRGKTRADLILVLWLLVIGLHLTLYYLFITGKSLTLPYLLGAEIPVPLFHGPLLYLYTEAVTNQVSSPRVRMLHLGPILLAYSVLAKFIISSSEHKIFVYEHSGIGYESITSFILGMIIISGVAYVALSLRLLGRHRRLIKDQFSYAEKINLAWLRYLIYGIGVIWITVIVGNDTYTYSAAVIFVILLGYFGINQVGIFTEKPEVSPQAASGEALNPKNAAPDPPSDSASHLSDNIEMSSIEEPGKTKYQKSSLNPAFAENIHKQLTEVMQEKKLYTDPELTLDELAQTLNVHRNNLSQIINTYEQKSFYDYINLKRVEEFKRIVSLPGNQKFTLLGLANDCGFNSKTSFNRNFKNVTGLSPSEYLKQANILLEQ